MYFLELIKTEVHLVHTLKILLGVFMHELRQSQLIEEGRLKRLFLGIESLLIVHEHFLKCLKMCRNQSQEEGNPINYQISQITDILISQVRWESSAPYLLTCSLFTHPEGKML